MDETGGEVTHLLKRLAAGDLSAEEELVPRVYVELHRLAAAQLRGERPGHTLQATALVHEVYLRHCRQDGIDWQNRSHFFRIAARLMRRVLIDYARQRNAAKRGDGAVPVELDEGLVISEDQLAAAVEVDEILERLSALSQRQAQVVEMRFFAGLSEAEIAEVLNVTTRTVKRDWYMARAWLHEQLKRTDP